MVPSNRGGSVELDVKCQLDGIFTTVQKDTARGQHGILILPRGKEVPGHLKLDPAGYAAVCLESFLIRPVVFKILK